ncbi:MAG: S-layer homology domain-containing protein [Oscillatoriales cyanobacterium SM2_1_8]|nr:S-layer homology domain-containing protein [Oscillatoriales cyanobacterium SM2_1_8]
MMPRILWSLVLLGSLAGPAIATDNDPGAIERIVNRGWMSRDRQGNFREGEFVSRAELANVLVKAFELNRRQGQANIPVPSDVPRSHWAYADIQRVLATGVMGGVNGNRFLPNGRLSRAEGFAIFANAFGVYQFPTATIDEILRPFPDAKEVPPWARQALATALNEGFVNLQAGAIQPQKPMTRGDLAHALARHLAKEQGRTQQFPEPR